MEYLHNLQVRRVAVSCLFTSALTTSWQSMIDILIAKGEEKGYDLLKTRRIRYYREESYYIVS